MDTSNLNNGNRNSENRNEEQQNGARKIIKVCGMRDGENIRQVAALGVDWIGMIFWKQSPRNVTMIPSGAGIIPDRASEKLAPVAENSYDAGLSDKPTALPKRVGVFVDEMAQNIITRVVQYRLDIVQLHGNESPTLIRNLRATLADIRPGLRFIKAISIPDSAVAHEAIDSWKLYAGCVDYLLFDTKCKSVGGSGQQFDWSVLDCYDGTIPFLLSGGIGPDDAERVRLFRHPQCIGFDLNSRFETAPAEKDVAALQHFLSQLRKD